MSNTNSPETRLQKKRNLNDPSCIYIVYRVKTSEDVVKSQDAELVQRTLQGDKNAFDRLVSKYQGAVYGLCLHLVGNFADAQDLAQEAFVRAYLELYQLREPSKFANWLYRVTANVCKMWLRKRKTDIASLDTIVPAEFISTLPSPQEVVENEELQLPG